MSKAQPNDNTTNYSDGILIVNRGGPELDYLASTLSQRGLLSKYVRPYVNKGRLWEQALAKLLGKVYQHTVGRRKMPSGIDLTRVIEVGVIEDFAIAIVRYLAIRIPYIPKIISRWLFLFNERIMNKVGNVGSSHVQNSSILIGASMVALPAFSITSKRRVLNYPIAHHRYILNWAQEEAEISPEFASMLPTIQDYIEYEKQMDEECKLADVILVGSTFARDSHIKSGIPAEKIIVVPYGAELRLFSPPDEQTNKGNILKILYVGQISQRKGISYLLKAYKKFSGPDTSLTLVGNIYKCSKPLEPFRHLFNHILNIPRSHLAEIYRRSNVFVFPTLIEGMGLVVLEAMASGLPVIVTPNGPGDIVRDGVDGFIVPPRDIDAIVDRLEYFRKHPEQRIQMGKNARARATVFNWENYSKAAISAIFDGLQIHPGLVEHSNNHH